MEINRYMARYLQIVNNMVSKMKNSPRCANISVNFINEMIPHHEGAIEMCNNLLRYRIDTRLRKIAIGIIKEQSKGVMELKKVKNELCACN